MTDIDTAAIRELHQHVSRSGLGTTSLEDEVPALLDALAAANATIERVREVRANLSWTPYPERSAPDVVVGVDDLDAALSDAPVSDAAEPVDEWGETAAQRAVRIGARDAALREYEVESANDGVPLDGPRVVAFKAGYGYGYGYANRPTDAAEPDARSVDRCPEWNCPDLSAEDRRDGKKCAEHPCACADAARPAPSVEYGIALERSGVRYSVKPCASEDVARELAGDWAGGGGWYQVAVSRERTEWVALSPRVESTPDENGGE